MSSDNETPEDGCTELVLGFHHHIKEWWGKVLSLQQRVRFRGQLRAGNGEADHGALLHDVAKIWKTQDTEAYCGFVPVQCKQVQVRVTRMLEISR